MIIHVIQVTVTPPYTLDLFFDNGKRKRVNLRQELYGPIFEALRDPQYFAKVYVDPDSRTVAWPNGADFAPDFLYQLEQTSAEVALDVGVAVHEDQADYGSTEEQP